MSRLWASLILVVGLRLARALVTIGSKLARRGDQLGTRVLVYVQRLAQRQDAARERKQYDQDETPDKRHPTRCPGCGMLEIEGHAPNCDRM